MIEKKFTVLATYELDAACLDKVTDDIAYVLGVGYEKKIDLSKDINKQFEEGYLQAEIYYKDFLKEGYVFDRDYIEVHVDIDECEFGLLSEMIEDDFLNDNYSVWESKVKNIIEGLTSDNSEEYEAYWYLNNWNGSNCDYSLEEVLLNNVFVLSGLSRFQDFCVEHIKEDYELPDSFPWYYIAQRAIDEYANSILYQELPDGRVVVVDL